MRKVARRHLPSKSLESSLLGKTENLEVIQREKTVVIKGRVPAFGEHLGTNKCSESRLLFYILRVVMTFVNVIILQECILYGGKVCSLHHVGSAM